MVLPGFGFGEGAAPVPAPSATLPDSLPSVGEALAFVTEFNQNVAIFETLANQVTLTALRAVVVSLSANANATQAKNAAVINKGSIIGLRSRMTQVESKVSQMGIDIFAANRRNHGYSYDGRRGFTPLEE